MASNSDNTTNSAASAGSNKTEDLTMLVDDFKLNLRISTSAASNVPPATSTDANVATVFDAASTSDVTPSSSVHANGIVATVFDAASTSDVTPSSSVHANVLAALVTASSFKLTAAPFASAAADVSSSSGSATSTTARRRTASRPKFSCRSKPYGVGDSGFNCRSTRTQSWIQAFVSALSATTLRSNSAATPRLASNVAAVPSHDKSSDEN